MGYLDPALKNPAEESEVDGCAFTKALFHVPKHNCWKETQKNSPAKM